MLISKFPVWICVLLSCGALALHAQDTPAQAAARAALQQKMDELDANPPAMTPPSAPANAPVIEVTPAGAAPVVETPAPTAAEQTPMLADPPPAVTVREATETGAVISNADVEVLKQADSAAQAKDAARKAKAAAATAEAAAETKAQAAAQANAEARKSKEAAANAQADSQTKAQAVADMQKQVEAAAQAKDTAQKTAAAAASAEADAEAKAQAAAQAAAEAQKSKEAAMQAEADAQVRAQTATQAKTQAETEAKSQTAMDAKKRAEAEKAAVSAAAVNYPGKEMGLKRIEAPDLPISASKAEKLHELLVRYKADQISAEEYHSQRAAVLAGP